MSYVDPDYTHRKRFKQAVADGVEHQTYNPIGFSTRQRGPDTIEGPHYPKPHRWYAAVIVRNGIVVKVK